jgi:hypothetical protein
MFCICLLFIVPLSLLSGSLVTFAWHLFRIEETASEYRKLYRLNSCGQPGIGQLPTLRLSGEITIIRLKGFGS